MIERGRTKKLLQSGCILKGNLLELQVENKYYYKSYSNSGHTFFEIKYRKINYFFSVLLLVGVTIIRFFSAKLYITHCQVM